jgi:hypothetical protein
MVDLKLYSSKTGLRVGLMLRDGSIKDAMLSEKDLKLISSLKDVVLKLPEFRGAIFELEDRAFLVFNVEEGFLIFSTVNENVGSTYYNVEKVLEEIKG